MQKLTKTIADLMNKVSSMESDQIQNEEQIRYLNRQMEEEKTENFLAKEHNEEQIRNLNQKVAGKMLDYKKLRLKIQRFYFALHQLNVCKLLYK